MKKIKKIAASLIRGGTSKGLFFNENDLPPAGPERDAMLLSIMGSPDQSRAVSISHPTGIMQVDAKVTCDASGRWIAQSSGFVRTAKIIMVGEAYLCGQRRERQSLSGAHPS